MRAFIFDMDGVIINSEPIHYKVDSKTFEKLGVKLSKDDIEGFVGMTNSEILKILKKKFKFKENIQDIVDLEVKTKIKILEDEDYKPIDGITDLVDNLKSNNILIAVASSSPRKFIEAVLTKFKIIDKFHEIICGEEVPKGKPEPDIYLKTAKELGVKVGDCVVLEDSTNGIAAAKAAGMKCIGFANKDSGNQDYSKADIVVKSIREINLTILDL